ncbi:uncharacterized protein N7506_011209 [Penicillium brevicompactum]|uniref:uncharacterized protein n=1 Tax=Penicillium brevicompactum TaxID=5074 RepID=UPI0025401D02|nr:uncharacterized protein N7506_011209 [Penicillium brevicompactum]KAJ5322079.1 hypothetical protein N7506_011209 [Penicillium brevicompactum]
MSITEAKSESHLQHDYLVLQLTSGSAPTADRAVIAQQPEKATSEPKVTCQYRVSCIYFPQLDVADLDHRYTRALEERIRDLESQIPEDRSKEASASRQTSRRDSRRRIGDSLPRKEPIERTISGHVSTPLSQESFASRRAEFPQDVGVYSSSPQRAQPSLPSQSTLPRPSFTLPFAEGTNDFPDSHTRSGHSSLLVGILATLTGTESTRDSSTLFEGSSTSTPSVLTDQLYSTDRSVHISDVTSDRLVRIYLERVNPRYPFLHRDTFLAWYESWKIQSHVNTARDQQSLWKRYFVTMVHAVALLLTPQVSVSDIATSQSLYNTAIKYLAHVFAQPDPVLHAQAYLLLTLHALHSPSSQMIVTIVSAMMRYCVMAQLHLAESEPKVTNPAFSLEVQTRRRVFWSAYALDRFISWIYHIPNNIIDEHISVQLFSNVTDAELHSEKSNDVNIRIETPSQKTHISPALHLFRCRRIQSRIISTMMRSDFEEINATTPWREHMLGELDSWRSQLGLLSDVASKSYTSDRWVGMAYNYTILLLHQPTKENVCNGFGDRSVPACVQIALTFRTFQKDRQTAQLWPGLLSQVSVGITLLYCFWATPPQNQTPAYRSKEVPEALRACSISLAILAERWVQAEPLRDVFDILAKEVPLNETIADTSPRRISAESASYIQSQLPILTSIIMHRGVMRMIREMITEDFPESLNGGLEHALPSQDGSIPQNLGGHLCSSNCPFFREPGRPGLTTVMDPQIYAPFGDEISGDLGIDDETLIFPLLFGSAEF